MKSIEISPTKWTLSQEQREAVAKGVHRYDSGRIAVQLALESPDVPDPHDLYLASTGYQKCPLLINCNFEL